VKNSYRRGSQQKTEEKREKITMFTVEMKKKPSNTHQKEETTPD